VEIAVHSKPLGSSLPGEQLLAKLACSNVSFTQFSHVNGEGFMKVPTFVGLALVLLVSAGCGPDKPAPAGALYQGKHVSEWGDQLKSPDRQKRLEAAKVLVQMAKEGTKTREAIQALQDTLNDQDPEVRGWAAVALVYAARGTPFPIGSVAGKTLKEAAASSDAALRAEASDMAKEMSAGAAGPGGPPRPGGARPKDGTGPAGQKNSPATDRPTAPEKKAATEPKKDAPKDGKP
jgi:hypothetical protein